MLAVSDTHLSARTPEALANWEAVVRWATERDPAVVVHLGDVTADGFELPEDLALAQEALARLPAPVQVVPGNHDVGDNPGVGSPQTSVSPAMLDRYRAALGPDRWRVDVPGWRLLGVDALLFGSGLGDEADQWDWLDAEVAEVAATAASASPTRLGVFLHKPLDPTPLHPTDTTSTRYVPEPARARLHELLDRVPGSFVASGHCHQFSSYAHDGLTTLWIPSTWAVIPDRVQPRMGEKVCGVVELRLGEDGNLRTQLVLPAGVHQHVLGDTLPYPHP